MLGLSQGLLASADSFRKEDKTRWAVLENKIKHSFRSRVHNIQMNRKAILHVYIIMKAWSVSSMLTHISKYDRIVLYGSLKVMCNHLFQSMIETHHNCRCY